LRRLLGNLLVPSLLLPPSVGGHNRTKKLVGGGDRRRQFLYAPLEQSYFRSAELWSNASTILLNAKQGMRYHHDDSVRILKSA
jgi:hypothetical protein